MEIYTSRKGQFTKTVEGLKKQYNQISFLRLISMIVSLIMLFYYIETKEVYFEILAIVLVVVFIFFHTNSFKTKLQNQVFRSVDSN